MQAKHNEWALGHMLVLNDMKSSPEWVNISSSSQFAVFFFLYDENRFKIASHFARFAFPERSTKRLEPMNCFPLF